MRHLPRYAGPSLRLFGHERRECQMTRGLSLTDIDAHDLAID
jgi:hypothetical protein